MRHRLFPRWDVLSEFAHRFEAHVNAATPDETVFAELRGRSVSLRFAPDYFAYTTAERLQPKVAMLGRLLWVRWTGAYYAAFSETAGYRVTYEPPAATDSDRRFRAARSQLVAEGASADGLLRLSATGMWHWTITIAPHAVPAVGEVVFCRAAAEAAERLIADQCAKTAALRAEIYDPTTTSGSPREEGAR